ncbi:MAG: hypothetical protein EOO59_03465 [Hymenobacter sp.]|nr:MAG: hypothetical protein EOO59_03465 [Hymenobacter sp.]
MQLLYATGCCLLSLFGAASASRAQAPPGPDSVRVRPAQWLVKGGLRFTHLSASRTSTSWQMLVPLSLAAERRLGRASLYAQLDADVQLSSAGARRRRAATNTSLPTAALGMGGRYYYSRPTARQGYQPTAPEFGGYLALEAGASTTQAATRSRSHASSRATLTPSLYVLWGTQNRLRHHFLWDLNAGLGLQAPVRITEYSLPQRSWDLGLQANIRLYWGN